MLHLKKKKKSHGLQLRSGATKYTDNFFFKRKWVGELGQKEKQNGGQEAAIVIQNGDNDGGNYNDCSGRNRNGQIWENLQEMEMTEHAGETDMVKGMSGK